MKRSRKNAFDWGPVAWDALAWSAIAATALALCAPRIASAAWWPLSSSEEPAKLTSKKKTPSKPTKSSSKTSKSPGMVSGVTSGTKKLLTSPTAMFSGDKKSSPPKSHAKATKKAEPKKGEKPGWFKSMFVKEETPPPRSIKEWMSLPRNDP